MIENIPSAWSLRITRNIAGMMNVIAALIIPNRNKVIRPPQRGLDTKLMRRYNVFLLLSWAFIGMLGHLSILMSLLDFACSTRLSGSKAAAVCAILDLGTEIERVLVRVASD